jgi:two-component system sensor histidine kinase HydH
VRDRFLGRYGRIGWLATTLALAIGLVVTSWSNLRGARGAASTVTRGQADLLNAALRPLFQQSPSAELSEAELKEFLSAHSQRGLRYIALLNPDSTITASAGQARAPMTMPPLVAGGGPGPQYVRQLDDRIRVYSVRPRPRSAGPPQRGRAQQQPPPGGPGQGRPRYLHYAVLEFEPIIARGLVARAERSMLLTWIGASILTLAALLFWRTSEQYERAQTRLEEQKRLSLLGEMSAVLAHEIRNPLASLKGNAQLMAERMSPGTKERARAERVVIEATRLESLTSDLLDFARSGPIELRPANPIEVLRISIADIAEDGFEVDTRSAPQQWTMDSNRVRHALVNILQNARQASPDQHAPSVRVTEERGRLVYEVRDYGAGLPAEKADRIFDPFFTTRTNGTGLGLAVARRVAELHGGNISAHNHPEGGAVFRIELPKS